MTDIRLLALDVDGVLTDGGIYLDDSGRELLRFNVVDGYGIKCWLESGRECVWITGRSNPAVAARAESLGIRTVLFNVVDKVAALTQIMKHLELEWNEVAYIGDDVVDLEAIRRVGLGIAVADAVDDVRDAADVVTRRNGGHGAVREIVDRLLTEMP